MQHITANFHLKWKRANRVALQTCNEKYKGKGIFRRRSNRLLSVTDHRRIWRKKKEECDPKRRGL